MLKRFQGKRRKLRFVTYDLEWTPHTMAQRLVGLYDGKCYRCYPNTLEFLRNELTHRNRGKIFFAHAGGMADIQFVLEELVKRDNPAFRFKGCQSGSSLIICRITAGRNAWTFCDSYWLLRDSLAKIGDSIGLAKGGGEYKCSNYPDCGHTEKSKPMCIYYSPQGILTDYNALDCRILYAAISRLEDEVWALGGELRATIASTALFLFRSSFLRRDIPTSKVVNKIARDAYIASRVEVIQRNCGEASYYDINSSFPWSMTKPQPGRLLRTDKVYYEGDHMVIADATVSVPWMYIPPVPVRVNGRVYFAVGKFRRWFTGEDLELLLESGGMIESIHEAMHFEPFDDLFGYVASVYEMRRKTTDPFQRLVYKYLMNSLYGKFGEGNEKSALVINPKKRPKHILKVYRAGIYQVRDEVEIHHAHVPISANITASSRGLLTRHLQDASRSEQVYYCDTDSIFTTKEMESSDQLGDLKCEYRVEKGTFLSPKLYRTFPGPKIRAKGFPKLDNDEFEALIRGDAVTVQRMVRVRENFSQGCFSPREHEYAKRAISHLSPEELERAGITRSHWMRPKRALETDGNTRPWHHDELLDASEKSL